MEYSNLDLQLTLRDQLPKVQSVWYCYDPPVVIIAATWYETPVLFSELLHNKLALDYQGNLDLVSALYLSCSKSIEHFSRLYELIPHCKAFRRAFVQLVESI
jgi:hypothetical protein